MKHLESILWPAASFLLLVGVLIYQQNFHAQAQVEDGYFEGIADAMLAIPLSHGDWNGVNAEVPQSAVELLNANEVRSVAFSHMDTGETVEVVIVHCSDARDLIGHYPPVCYPASGWEKQETRPLTLVNSLYDAPTGDLQTTGDEAADQPASPLTGVEFPSSYYRFVRVDEGFSHNLSVLNFMVLPDKRIGPSMDIVNQAAADLTKRGHGAMQVQILFRDPVMTDKRRLEIADEFLEYIQPVFSAVWE